MSIQKDMNKTVKPKKHLGQHFLKDLTIAERVADLFSDSHKTLKVLEIGPGMGVLTEFLLEKFANVYAVEIDSESVQYLNSTLVPKGLRLIEGDFLNQAEEKLFFTEPCTIVGNFPYNISSQIVFRILDHVETVEAFGGMFQKEVAERLVAKHGSKTYGILSVLMNAFYDSRYEFTIEPGVFNPPPKVKSGVIRCVRKANYSLPCSRKLFFEVVKMAFNQRRKTLRNSLHKFNLPESHEYAKLRAEQLSVEDFIKLTQYIEQTQ